MSAPDRVDGGRLRSGLYVGWLTHRRHVPRPHRFRYRVAYPHLFLDELDAVFDQHPLWSLERPNAVTHRRRDHLPGAEPTLDAAVRRRLAGSGPGSGDGTVSQLALVRTWGWLFDPIAVWFHHDRDLSPDRDADVDAAVIEVTNTPWKERTVYVLGGPGTHEVDKAMHVSPFMGMDQRYRISYEAPGARFRLHIASVEGDRTVHDAVLDLARRPLDRAAMSAYLWRHAALTHRVSLAIHGQAARLAAKGIPFRPHPARSQEVPT